MSRNSRRVRLPVAIASMAIVGWWLFGFDTHRDGAFTTRMHRTWGRTTRIDMSASQGGRTTRERVVYSWSAPYEPGDPSTSCAAILPEVRQDWDAKGHWDTWLYRIGPDQRGECSVQYRVDLTADGQPDWQFISRHGEQEQARSRIVARRGF